MNTTHHIQYLNTINSNLPAIKPKQTKITKIESPMLLKINKLHQSNIKTFYKQQIQTESMNQSFLVNKNNYIKTILPKKQSVRQKVLQNLQTKSKNIKNHILNKTNKQKSNYSQLMVINNSIVSNSHQKEMSKIQKANQRKELIITSRTKYFKSSRLNNMNDKNQQIKKLQNLSLTRSKLLLQKTVQKLQKADKLRKQLNNYKSQMSKSNLNQSIISAKSYIHQIDNERQIKLLESTLTKFKRRQELIENQKQKIKRKIKYSKQINNSRLLKVQNNKQNKQKQMQQNLQKMNQEKNRKITQIRNRKQRDLKVLSLTMRDSRQRRIQQSMRKSKLLYKDLQKKSDMIVLQRNQKWKKIKDIKELFSKTHSSNLFKIHQMTIRG